MVQVVTISASFGAGGSIVGPAVAERLGIPFVDRAIPAAVAESLAVPLDRALAHDQQLPSAIIRVLSKMASAVIPMGVAPMAPPEGTDQEDVFRSGTEQASCATSPTARAACSSAGPRRSSSPSTRPRSTSASTGPRPPAWPGRRRGDDRPEHEVGRVLDETDRARIAYVKHFYNRDPHDSRLYHLVLDSTALPLDVCVDLIVTAARART